MVRVYAALLAGLVVVGPILARAEDPLSGNYKVVIPQEEGSSMPWLVQFESKDGKWFAKVLDTGNEKIKGTAIEDFQVDKDLFRFRLKLLTTRLLFEGRIPKEKDSKIPVSLIVNGEVTPATLEPTALTTLDPFEIAKETVSKQTGGHELVQTAMMLLSVAAQKKAKPEEVRAWADKAARSAEAYGPAWHREIIVSISNLLAKQEGFANVALQYARKAEGLLDETKDSAAMKKRILTALETALAKAGKTDEAKEVQLRNNKIAYVTPKKFAGRKGNSDRVALVELFTCAQLPQCVAADLAFDALGQTYKPGEVVLLEYHLHRPALSPMEGPLADALTNPDALARASYYSNVRLTPVTFFNGRNPDKNGGGFGEGQARYDQFTTIVAGLLEEKAKASIKLSAAQKGNKIDIKADVSDLAEAGPDIRLRLVLVEDKAAYSGANTLTTYHSVVRDFPGGTAGTVLKDKTASKSVSVDLDEVRKKLTDYLDKTAQNAEFPNKERPMELKKLRVVAFVQNDDTGEVMQAAQVEVAPGE